jgi:SAM-dependent methyltransferase
MGGFGEAAAAVASEGPPARAPEEAAGGGGGSTYLSSFSERFGSYHGALRDFPDVLREEEAVAAEETLEGLEAEAEAEAGRGGSGWVVQLEAGGSVPRALRALPRFVAFDSHPQVLEVCAAAGEDVRPGSPFAIPLPAASAARVLFLAVLHHYDAAARRRIYAECLRVLRPGGALVIGDVAAGSPQDAWLNGFVDAHNPAGHRGIFFSPDPAGPDAALLRACGFVSVRARERRYAWRFGGAAAGAARTRRAEFLRRLFYLMRADDDVQIDAAAERIFGGGGGGGGADIPWRLVYLSGSKPAPKEAAEE